EDDFTVGIARDVPALRVDQPMVVLTQQSEILQVGLAAPDPPVQMMGLGEDGVGAPGEAAAAIPAPDLAPLCGRRATASPTFVHGVAGFVVDCDDHGGIAG